MHGSADLHFYIISLADNANIGATNLAKKVQRRLWLLTQSKPQAVLLTTLADGHFHVLGHTIEPIRRARTTYALVGALMVVKHHPVIKSAAGIGIRSEQCFFKELSPDGLPEPLDFAKGHGVMRSRSNMLDALLF